MKISSFQNWFVAVGIATFLAGNVWAQDSTTTTSTVSTMPQLSYGVPQVLQLSRAKIGDSTIVSYIQNSGTIYSLNADQIIYLKQQGVSDSVLNAMLNQRSHLIGSTESATSTAAQMPTASAPSTVTYVQSAPPSTVYVMPDTQTYEYDNWFYGYPYNYGWSYPAVSVSLGFGGHWGGGWHGGYRGGFHGGGHGGWHR